MHREDTVPHGSIPAGAPRGRALRVGIGGPVGGGKTALVAALCRRLGNELSIVAVTNDIYTTEDADFLCRAGALPPERIRAVRTGCCPHTAIRDDITANLDEVESLEQRFDPDLVLVESGGDNLTATFSYGLIDRQIFVVDVAGGDKVPRKGGPEVTRSDLLVINKIDLAGMVAADLAVMRTDSDAQRGDRPTRFTSLREDPAATITLTSVVFGDEPHWTPSPELIELHPGELWARHTGGDRCAVVTYPRRHALGHTLTTGEVRVADLLGIGGVYDQPEGHRWLATTSRAVSVPLPEHHPARRYRRFIDDLWDGLVARCMDNNPHNWRDAAPPMPALNRRPDGTWQIGFALHGDDDDADASFLAAMIDSYGVPNEQWHIGPVPERGHWPNDDIWQRLGLPPQSVQARPLPAEALRVLGDDNPF